MKQPHKHKDLIVAWANGAEIEWLDENTWVTARPPEWLENLEYRIKPEMKPDVVNTYDLRLRIRLTFDGETCTLKNAEVLE
jgi:hypothetical protein